MNKDIYRFCLVALIVIANLTGLQAQTLNLYYGDPNGDPQDAFDGNVLQAGAQTGNAFVYAVLGGGAQSFQIFSPGENVTKTITTTGGFAIQPIASMVVDKTKILNFSGTVTGSVSIIVRQLLINTISANVATDVAPGSELTVSYTTGAGTFPVDLAIGKFKVQLLDANNILLRDLLNSTDQYAGKEKSTSSGGGTRYIKATLPPDLGNGSYRVRVVTQGLISNILGTPSPLFATRINNPTIAITGVGTGNFCAGAMVVFPFSTTGTFPSGNLYKVQLINSAGVVTQDLTGTSQSSPINALLPSNLSAGAYRFRIASTTTNVVSNTSTINVSTPPTLNISGDASIVAGGQPTIQLNFTGTPPWTVNYTDYSPSLATTYTTSITTSTSSVTIRPILYSTTTYDKNYIKKFTDAGCGVSTAINGLAQITVTPITITAGTVSSTSCPGSAFSVLFTTSSPLPSDAICQVQVSDASGNFQNGQIIGTGGRTGPISATLPQNLTSGTGYKIRVILQQPTIQGAIDYNTAINPIAVPLSISRPEAPKVADVYFCQGASLGQLTATGSNLKWYVSVNTAQALASAPIPPNDRSSQYFVTQTINGCESTRAVINVNPKPTPAAPAVSSVAVCQGAQGQFSTSIPGARWYTSATGGDPLPQPPIVNNQTSGSQTFYVTQTIDGCESPRAAVTATVYPIPVAPTAQTPNPLCQYAPSISLSATGQNLTWYDQSGKLTGTPIPETNTSGTKSYSVSQTINGCESPRSTVLQVIRSAPATPSISTNPVRYCVGDVPGALTATGSNLRWYNVATGGSGSTNPPTFGTQTATTFTFYVTQTDNNSCESLRQPLSVLVISAPSAPLVTANQIVCQFAKVNPLSATPNNGLLWQGSGIVGTTEIAPTPITTQPATFTYAVTQKAGSCTSPASTIIYTVRKTPDAPKVVSPTAYCIGQNNTPLTAVADGQLIWYTNADHSGVSSPQVIPNTQQASITTYYVTQTDAFKCESPNSVLEVRISAKATARLTGDGNIYSGDSTAIRVRLTGDGPWTFTDWNNKPVTTADSLYVVWEKPRTTRTYAITNLKSSCGSGDIKNSYTLIVRVPLGVQSLSESLSFKAYPNPTTGDITVDWSSPTKQEINLQIVSMDGKVIKQVTRQAIKLTQTELFQLGSYPAGTYFLWVTTIKNGQLTKAIIKQ